MHTTLRIFVLGSCLFIAKICIGQRQYAVDLIDPSLVKNANAVIRSSNIDITLKQDLGVLYREEAVITVFNKKAQQFLNFYAGYKEGTSKVKDVSLKYLDAGGNIISELKSKDLLDYDNAVSYALISDYRAKFYDFDPGNYAVTIVYAYTLESKNSDLTGWHPIPDFRVSIESSSLRITNESDTKIHFKESNFNDYNIKSNALLHYEMLMQTAIIEETFMPPHKMVLPRVEFQAERFVYENIEGISSTWEELGIWSYQKLLEGRNSVSKTQLLSDLKQHLGDGLSERQIVEQAYDYLQKNTRYIYIGLDEGGYVPLDVKTVHELNYGDCKALSYYMFSILDAYDIPSDYVVVNAQDDYQESFYDDFVSLHQGNHIILRVPMLQDTVWLECTINDMPFNFLGEFSDNREVFAVNKTGGKLTRTPDYGYSLNTKSMMGSCQIDPDGKINAKLNIAHIGMGFTTIKAISEFDKKDSHEYLHKHLFGEFNGLEVDSLNYEFNEESYTAEEQYKLTATNHSEIAGDYILIPIKFMSMDVPALKKTKNRKHPVYFVRKLQQESKIRYEIPSTYRLDAIKANVFEESEYGSYSLYIEKEDDHSFTITRIFKRNQGLYPSEEYDNVKSFFDKIRKLESEYITISKAKT